MNNKNPWMNLLLGFLVIVSVSFAVGPVDRSANGIIAWVEAGGGIASGSGIPVSVVAEGSLYVDKTDPATPKLYRYTSGAWALISGSGGGGSGVATHSLLTNLDYASSGHTGFTGATETASITNTLNGHTAKTTDAHGKNEIISESIQVGSGTDAYIGWSATGTIMIGSYTALPGEIATPTNLASGVVVLWNDANTGKLRAFDGSAWHNLW